MVKGKLTLDQIWDGDLLQRRMEAAFLEQFLNTSFQSSTRISGRTSLVINLKARWGSGKTFFLSRFAQQLRLSGHKVVELNAWKAEPDIDPLIALVAAIRKEILPDLKKKGAVSKAFSVAKAAGGTIVWRTTKGVALGLVKKAVSNQADDIGDAISDAVAEQSAEAAEVAEVLVDEIGDAASEAIDGLDADLNVASYFAKEVERVGKQEKAVDLFSKNVGEIAKAYAKRRSGKAPFYVIIDELDRCRPTFAIELLERVNHLFDIEGLVFIVATDSDELQHSINAVYGSKFDSKGYLNRFFGYTYNLAEPSLDEWIEYLVDQYALDLSKYAVPHENAPHRILKSFGDAANLRARDYLHVFFLMQTVERLWDHKAKIDLITLYAFAIAIFLKEDDYLDQLTMSSESQKSVLFNSLGKAELVSRTRGNPNTVRLNNYLQRMQQDAQKPAFKILSDIQARDESSTTSDHRRDLLYSQLDGRRQDKVRGELPLWSQYRERLKRASRVTLPEEDDA